MAKRKTQYSSDDVRRLVQGQQQAGFPVYSDYQSDVAAYTAEQERLLAEEAEAAEEAALQEELATSAQDYQDTIDLEGEDSIAEAEALLAQAAAVTEEQLTGAIPEDVQAEVEQIAAEEGMLVGAGQDQAQDFMTAADLGMTSLEIQQMGIQNASALSQSYAQLASVQSDYNQLVESMRQWDQGYQATLQQLEISEAELYLQGMELISENMQFAMQMSTQLIIANAQYEIEGLQQNIDTILGSATQDAYMYEVNQAILEGLD